MSRLASAAPAYQVSEALAFVRDGVLLPHYGRRERNKRDKLERIIAAARELFDAYGVDAVTTQQIADKADIPRRTGCDTAIEL